MINMVGIDNSIRTAKVVPRISSMIDIFYHGMMYLMDKQIIFIDDAGDPGFKRGSSRYFVIACVIFESEAEATLASAIIGAQIERLGWYGKTEFKFHQTQKKHKLDLFKRLKDARFKIVATIIDKSALDKATKPSALYNETIRDTLLLCDPMGAKVRLDGHAGHDYNKGAVSYFRKSINRGNKNERKIIHFRFIDSKENMLIQLADLVAGSILRSTNRSKTDSQEYLKALKGKVKLIKTVE